MSSVVSARKKLNVVFSSRPGTTELLHSICRRDAVCVCVGGWGDWGTLGLVLIFVWGPRKILKHLNRLTSWSHSVYLEEHHDCSRSRRTYLTQPKAYVTL